MSILLIFLFLIGGTFSVNIEGNSARVYNGTLATKGQFPWQVALYIPKNAGLDFCGGALISELWVLTAAHCLYGAYFRIRVLLGSTMSTGEDSNQVELHARWWTFYEFDPWSHEGDLGLVKLPEAVTFTDFIKPITLASKPIDLGTSVTVSGWGSTNSDGARVVNLTYSNILITNSDACRNYNQGSFCGTADPSSKSGNICGGDSGGAVVLDATTNPVHVGVVSWYSGTCNENTTAGFTETASFVDWIVEQTGGTVL